MLKEILTRKTRLAKILTNEGNLNHNLTPFENEYRDEKLCQI